MPNSIPRGKRNPDFKGAIASITALALITNLGVSTTAQARKSDRQQVMKVDADNGDWTTADDGASELSGNVRIVQGSLKIDADKARVENGNGEIQKVILYGAPARLEEELDDGSGMLNAAAREIHYDLVKNEVILIGAVEVQKPRGKLTGERIRYDLGSGRMNATGGNSRIQMRLEPAKAKT